MLLGLITLFTALSISGIAAYYSIVGLTAIFAAAYWPIVLMGGVLEVGKVITTLWLHYNWTRANWKIKSYLVTAVGVLMLITSMGIFGFLSKSHLDQAIPSGDIQAQVSLIDEKIATQKDNIEVARKAISQLNNVVDQTIARTTDDKGVNRSAYFLRSQKKERAALQKDIDDAQAEISKLQEERAPIASKFRQAEAEVGPIKYIAALIYGDKATQSMLESAVRMVIIIIVFVFDPLAIVLILAATTSIDWSKIDKRNKVKEENEIKEEKEETDELPPAKLEVDKLVEEARQLAYAEAEAKYEKIRLADVTEAEAKAKEQLRIANEQVLISTEEQHRREEEVVEIAKMLSTMTEQVNDLTATINGMEEEVAGTLTREGSLQNDFKTIVAEYDALVAQKHALEETFEAVKKELESFDEVVRQMGVLQTALDEKNVEIEKLQNALKQNFATMAEAILPLQEPLPSEMDKVLHNHLWELYDVVEEPKSETPVVIPNTKLRPDNSTILTAGGNASFGIAFPSNPSENDLFLRVDYMPSKLFKWSDTRWIEVDKSNTETLIYDEDYLKLLVNKISTGEYDINKLSTAERDQIATYLKTHPTA